jgi:hypothetical protein
MAKTPCETCPYFFDPNDEELWERIREAQREVTPELTEETNAHLSDVEHRIAEGLAQHTDECPGYSRRAYIAREIMIRLGGGFGYLVSTEAGTRFMSAAEKSCNNPFRQTEEYRELSDQLTRQASDRFDSEVREQAS